MIGKNHIVWDATDIVKGMSSGPNVNDGGFSNETNAVNLIYDPGTVNGVPAMVDKSTNLTGSAIAWCASDVISTNGYVLATDGKVSSIDTSQVLTTSSALTGTFTTGTSDIINFFPAGDADKLYITSADDIAKMDSNLTNGVPSWWVGTLGKAPLATGVRHPMLKYIGRVYVADGNKIHNILSSSSGTYATTSNPGTLVLDSENQITALGIDASTGLMMVATSHGANYSGGIATANRVFLWDGQSTVPSRELQVGGQICGILNVGGLTLCTYPQSLGYWNGADVSFLRRLKNVTLTGSDLPYKHHLARIGNTAYVVDGKQILAYGEVLPGKKIFYYALDNTVNSNNFSLVCPVGDNKIGVGFATTKFYSFDTVGTGVGSLNALKSLRFSFPNPAFVRSVSLEYSGAGVADADTGRALSYRTQANATFTGMMSLTNSSGGTIWETNDIAGIADTDNPCRWIQFLYSSIDTCGLRRMVVYYDPAE